MVFNKYLIPLAAVAVIGAGAYGVSRATAASSASGTPSLVQRLADTFHLDPAKVQAVVDQSRADHQTQAESRYEAKLSQAVSAGKLTSSQQQAILAEHNKLKSELQDAMSKTGADRRTAMQQIRTEATAWSQQNNLPAHWLLGPRPMRGMGPMGHMAPSASPSPSASASPSASPGA